MYHTPCSILKYAADVPAGRGTCAEIPETDTPSIGVMKPGRARANFAPSQIHAPRLSSHLNTDLTLDAYFGRQVAATMHSD
jgi:hypothetical protein